MWGPPQALAFPNLLAVPLVVSRFVNTDRDLDRALSWPEQGRGKGPCSPPSCSRSSCVSCTGTYGHLGRVSLGAPLTRTVETLFSHPSRQGSPSRKKSQSPGAGYGLFNWEPLTGSLFPAPWMAGASLTPSPLASSAAAPKVWFQMGFVWFCFCLGCVGHCGLRVMFLLLPNSHVLTFLG